jgi:hypothetical protein
VAQEPARQQLGLHTPSLDKARDGIIFNLLIRGSSSLSSSGRSTMPKSTPPPLTSYITTTASVGNPRNSAALSQTPNPSLFSSLQSCLSPEFIGGRRFRPPRAPRGGLVRLDISIISGKGIEGEARSRANRSVPFSPDLVGIHVDSVISDHRRPRQVTC